MSAKQNKNEDGAQWGKGEPTKRATTSFEAIQVKAAAHQKAAEKSKTASIAATAKQEKAVKKDLTQTLKSIKTGTGLFGKKEDGGGRGKTRRLGTGQLVAATAGAAPLQMDAPYLAPYQPQKAHAGPLGTVGNILYFLGFAAEYLCVKGWRIARDFFIVLAQVLVWVFGTVFGWLAALLRGVWQDLTEPFRQFAHNRRQLENVRQRAERFGYTQREVPGFLSVKVKSAFRFLLSVGGILMPVVAAAVLLFTIHNVTTMQYALAVEIDGKVLGYVADQSVVEGAKGLLRDRIRLAEGQEVADWQLNPTYSIGRARQYTTTQQLANEILLSGSKTPGDLVQATGLYVDGELFAVTENGRELRDFLDELLRQEKSQSPDNVDVSFVHAIECEPQQEDVFFASSVMIYDDLLARLKRNVVESKIVVADGEQTLGEIAVENDIGQDTILQRNPGLAAADDSYVPDAGRSIVIRQAQPLLQAQRVERVSRVETIPYTEQVIEIDDLALGVRNKTQEGVEGSQEVWEDVVTINGEEVERRRVNELTVVLQQPVDEITEVGTYDYSGRQLSDIGNEYIFPVPDSTRSSRGMSSYHRGLDINAPMGTPVFACQAGTVITAGWHYSYGYQVIIDHGNGMVTLYAHNSSLAVTQGQQVEQGEYIAAVGSTGNSSGPHVHLEFQLNGQLRNPWDYVQPPAAYRMNTG